MDRKQFLAIGLCFLIFAVWQKYYIEPRSNIPVNSITPRESTVNSAPLVRPKSTTSETRASAITLPIQTGTGTASLGNGNVLFQGWALKNYHLGVGVETPPVDLQWVTHHDGQVEVDFDDPSFRYLRDIRASLQSTSQGARWEYEDSAIQMIREIESPSSLPYVNLNLRMRFKAKHPNYAFVSISNQSFEKDEEAPDRQLVYFANNTIERIQADQAVSQKEVPTPVRYVGATSRYFLFALIPKSPSEPKALIQPGKDGGGRINLVYSVTGDEVNILFKVYFGPKELAMLRAVDPILDHTVDFGWFTAVAYPILQLLRWLYQFVGNYGTAIILLTLLLKIVTYPLTYKSMKSMKEMQKIQPQLQKIREKYKDDPQALNREMLTVMRSHGYNPMAGCLPILIQMPIFFALYRVLYSSIELYHSPFALWINDLSKPDPFYVTPILLTAAMFFQQKLTPSTATDPVQAKMMMLMPLIFGVIMVNVPSGLTLYMLVNSIAGIVQQLLLNKKFSSMHVSSIPAPAR